MRYIRYVVCFGITVLACLSVSPSASAEQIIRCRSDDYQYNHCPTREHGPIRLTQQISKSACVEGRTWGYDRRGVWVDQGCDAKFRVAARRRDRDNRDNRDNRRGESLVCRSDGFAYNHCRANAVGKGSQVRLAKQISKTRCIQNKTWGTDERGIWVDQGCEAEFEIIARRSRDERRFRDERGSRNERGSPSPAAGNTIRCRSDSYSYQHCQADTRQGVQLARQLSQTECIQGQSWGHDQRGVWVDRGCEAEFQLGNSAGNPAGNALGQALGNLLAPPK